MARGPPAVRSHLLGRQTHDEREYVALAANLAAGRGFSYGPQQDSGTAQQFGRAPLYPMSLAAIGATGPAPEGTPIRVKVAQAALGGPLVGLIGVIALRAASPRAGILAAAIAAAYPPLVVYPRTSSAKRCTR